MTFKRYGKSRQLRIKSPDDLSDVLELDDARWAATGAPIESIYLDSGFLEFVDTDRNRRIMVYEVRAAVRWMRSVSRGCVPLARGDDGAEFSSLREGEPSGPADEGYPTLAELRIALGRVLDATRSSRAGKVTLAEVRALEARIAARPVSAEGIVLPAAVDDPDLSTFISDAISVTGGAEHPSGARGLTTETATSFVEGARALCAWMAEAPTWADSAAAAAYRFYLELRDKIDQHFLLCRAAALDPRVARRAYPSDAELAELAVDDPSSLAKVLHRMPLAPPPNDAPNDCPLSATDVVNPAYSDSFRRFLALLPKIGEPNSLRGTSGGEPGNGADGNQQLCEREWHRYRQLFELYGRWNANKPAFEFADVPTERINAYASGDYTTRFEALVESISRDLLSMEEARAVERFILYQMYLFRFVNNFVSFPQLYDNRARATFETGSLALDGRYFHFAVLVRDHARHVRIAKTSNMYVLYVSIRASDGTQKYEIAVPVTSGRVGGLCVGKRGVFHDVFGAEFDAEVTEILENPVSLGEAAVEPFRRLGEMITTRIDSLSAQSEKNLDAIAGQSVTRVYSSAQSSAEMGSAAAQSGAAPSTPLSPNGPRTAERASPGPSGSASGASGVAGSGAAGLLAGGGVAIAAIGSAVAYLTATLSKLPWWQILIGLFGAVLAVIIPSVIVAVIKLSRRDLSSILEGSGWAINSRMRLTRRLSRFFTQYPKRRFEVPAILGVRPGNR